MFVKGVICLFKGVRLRARESYPGPYSSGVVGVDMCIGYYVVLAAVEMRVEIFFLFWNLKGQGNCLANDFLMQLTRFLSVEISRVKIQIRCKERIDVGTIRTDRCSKRSAQI